MKWNENNTVSFSGLRRWLLMICSIMLLFSCNSLVNKNDSYNLGYKDGYIAGLKAGQEEAKKKIADENRKIEIDPAKNDIPTIPEFVDEEKKVNSDITVPEKAFLVLDFIRKNKKAPEGYVGGRHFGNYERHLPERDAAENKIEYQEWDIQPKVEGKNRGAQRIVTGNDGSAWYTPDHYNTFREIK